MKNSNYHMIIRVTDLELVDALVAKAIKLGLTVSNNKETKNGIENIELGHCISVGTSDKFHVNWARRIDYYADREIVPVYDISLDWTKITKRLNDYAEAVAEEQTVVVGDYIVEASEDDVILHDEDGDFVASLTRSDVEELLDLMDNQ